MIYTITFSPSIDYIIKTDTDFNPQGLNRIQNFDLFCGGKGINASVILKRLGFNNQAITFLGGNTQALFTKLLENESIDLKNFEVEATTRVNIKYFNNQQSFEINGPRTQINQKTFNVFLDYIKKFTPKDLVFIMGISDKEYLHSILSALKSKNVPFVLDVDIDNPAKILSYQPLIIKPNVDELGRMLNQTITSEEQIIEGMKNLHSLGANNVMVSNGAKGSYLYTNKGELYKIELQKIDSIVSTVGAGDTLLSSFVALYQQSNDVKAALRQATSMSIGTSSNMWLGDKNDLEKYADKIKITKLI